MKKINYFSKFYLKQQQKLAIYTYYLFLYNLYFFLPRIKIKVTTIARRLS